MAKTIKLLADGTVAKVGMIVYADEKICKIIRMYDLFSSGISTDSTPLAITPFGGWDSKHLPVRTDGMKYWHVPLDWSRKATKEERQQYYKQLNSNLNE